MHYYLVERTLNLKLDDLARFSFLLYDFGQIGLHFNVYTCKIEIITS